MDNQKEMTGSGRDENRTTQETGNQKEEVKDSINREQDPQKQDEQLGEDAASEQKRKEALTERD